MRTGLKTFILIVILSCSSQVERSNKAEDIQPSNDRDSVVTSVAVEGVPANKPDSIEHQQPQDEMDSTPSQKVEGNCEDSDVVREVLSGFTVGSSILSEDLPTKLKVNAQSDRGCRFPNGDPELLKLYDATKELEAASSSNQLAMETLIHLDIHMSWAIEYAEYMHDVIPRIALSNTTGFIKGVQSLDTRDQKIVLENLEYLPTLQDIEELRNKLELVEEDELQPTIELAQKAINRIFE